VSAPSEPEGSDPLAELRAKIKDLHEYDHGALDLYCSFGHYPDAQNDLVRSSSSVAHSRQCQVEIVALVLLARSEALWRIRDAPATPRWVQKARECGAIQSALTVY